MSKLLAGGTVYYLMGTHLLDFNTPDLWIISTFFQYALNLLVNKVRKGERRGGAWLGGSRTFTTNATYKIFAYTYLRDLPATQSCYRRMNHIHLQDAYKRGDHTSQSRRNRLFFSLLGLVRTVLRHLKGCIVRHQAQYCWGVSQRRGFHCHFMASGILSLCSAAQRSGVVASMVASSIATWCLPSVHFRFAC